MAPTFNSDKRMVLDSILRNIPSRKFLSAGPLSLDKCWSRHIQSDNSPQHEQKHLLHNRSNCCYRDHP
jgi:hypothetical protein